jgi:ABC-type multidrug transport system fused ATPase/permease subunit
VLFAHVTYSPQPRCKKLSSEFFSRFGAIGVSTPNTTKPASKLSCRLGLGLKPITNQIEQNAGEIVAVLGKTGCGKSTMFNIVVDSPNF